MRILMGRIGTAKLTLALAAATCFSTAATAPAAALVCGTSQQSLFFVEFPEGSAELEAQVRDAFMMQIVPLLSGGRFVDSYYVLASGDIAEGEAWEAASPEARQTDQQLGQARIDAILEMIRHQPTGLRSENIETRLRENRQDFSEAQLAADPALNQRLRAGIRATIRRPAPTPAPGEPAPLC